MTIEVTISEPALESMVLAACEAYAFLLIPESHPAMRRR